MPLASFDQQFLTSVPALVGVDEAGRGPLAGPVCAAAVYLQKGFYKSDWARRYAAEINDSKQLKQDTREKIFNAIPEAEEGLIQVACHMASVEEIEELNILGATRLAMTRCIEALLSRQSCSFDHVFEGEDWLLQHGRHQEMAQVLVDGRPLKPFPYTHTAIVKGDGKSLAIALASIVAKVTRDHYMVKQAEQYPEYGFTTNKGYGTAKHRAALLRLGPCTIHRPSFLTQILTPR
jgi:ribonuclease HII